MGPFFRKQGAVPSPRVTPVRPMFVGRPQYTGTWQPGIVTHPLHERHWAAKRQGINGAVSTVPEGRWQRGVLHRWVAPSLMPPMVGFWAYDPTAIQMLPGIPARVRSR